MNTGDSGIRWHFQRLGGLDQAMLTSAEELTHLGELDPKLWVALSCPASGLEFDQRTLSRIDTDNDGRIRMPEVLEAVAWLTARLADPAAMVAASETLPLERIAAQTPEGARLLATAAAVLAGLGKPGAGAVAYPDVAAALESAARKTFNGDGVIVPSAEFGPEANAFIEDALVVVGGVADASGAAGITGEIARAFAATLAAWQTWRESVEHAATPLGGRVAEAWNLVQELKDKINDYFLRCDMAAFAPWTRAEGAEEGACPVSERGLVQTAVLENLPLARIAPDRPLSLARGLNPAWRGRIARLAECVRPLLEEPETLSRGDWEKVLAAVEPYAAVLADKPAPVPASVGIAPAGGLDQLGEARVAGHLASGALETVLELIAKDAAAPAAATDIADLERLVLYHAHLYRLLMNFVSFHDFYAAGHKAMFQSGTLYLDGRSCTLCLPVTDVEAHAKLAGLSHLCLVYCRCSRLGDTPEAGVETTAIVAAVTAGNTDMLVEGRNGVFVDSLGRDWDAAVTKVVANPVSIREAVWEPYRRFARMVGTQIGKFAAAKREDVGKALDASAANAAEGKPPAFDIGKSVGIFAAIGLALGALGTAVASIARALFALAWWELPLVFLAVFLFISGPSMMLAWLKLRKRNLGPLLEASGWAINPLAPVNLPLGGRLTGTAVLPRAARRDVNDPLRKTGGALPVIAALLFGALLAAAVLWWHIRPTMTLP